MPEAVANPADYTLAANHPLRRSGNVGLLLGVVALAALGFAAAESPTQFFRSYLVAYLYWIGIALGSLVILMIQHVTGGPWGVRIRRILEASTRTLPLLTLLFVPIAFGIHDLFEWSHESVVAHDKILQHKSVYLNEQFFLVRAGIYFAIWLTLTFFLNRWSKQQDARGHTPSLGRKMTLLSRGGILLYALTITFASVDWAMSLEPHWFSTIYGVLFAGGQLLSAMAFAIFISARIVDRAPISDVFGIGCFHDLGKLLLAFVMLWAYFAFSQLIITYAGNLPEEIPWYLNRMEGGWEFVGLGVILFHFALPFVLLLSRDIKRNARSLAALAAFVLLVRFVDTYFMITPAFSPKDLVVHWQDLAAFVGVGGLWLATFVRQLQKRPLLPLQDPELA